MTAGPATTTDPEINREILVNDLPPWAKRLLELGLAVALAFLAAKYGITPAPIPPLPFAQPQPVVIVVGTGQTPPQVYGKGCGCEAEAEKAGK